MENWGFLTLCTGLDRKFSWRVGSETSSLRTHYDG